jgi:hypothetical protein
LKDEPLDDESPEEETPNRQEQEEELDGTVDWIRPSPSNAKNELYGCR